MSMSNSWTNAFRFLQKTEYNEDFDVEIVVMGRPDDDTVESDYDDDDDYLLEPWSWSIIVVLGALLLAGCIMYCSYRHELFSYPRRFGRQRVDEESLGEGM